MQSWLVHTLSIASVTSVYFITRVFITSIMYQGDDHCIKRRHPILISLGRARLTRSISRWVPFDCYGWSCPHSISSCGTSLEEIYPSVSGFDRVWGVGGLILNHISQTFYYLVERDRKVHTTLLNLVYMCRDPNGYDYLYVIHA